MRRFVSSAVIVAALATAPFAFAAQTTTIGVVKSIDIKARTLVLENGVTYALPAEYKDPGLKVGDRVHVTWELQNGKHEVSAITPQK